jgi:hypothetical protein
VSLGVDQGEPKFDKYLVMMMMIVTLIIMTIIIIIAVATNISHARSNPSTTPPNDIFSTVRDIQYILYSHNFQ